jgi:hypothetical protein
MSFVKAAIFLKDAITESSTPSIHNKELKISGKLSQNRKEINKINIFQDYL